MVQLQHRLSMRVGFSALSVGFLPQSPALSHRHHIASAWLPCSLRFVPHISCYTRGGLEQSCYRSEVSPL